MLFKKAALQLPASICFLTHQEPPRRRGSSRRARSPLSGVRVASPSAIVSHVSVPTTFAFLPTIGSTRGRASACTANDLHLRCDPLRRPRRIPRIRRRIAHRHKDRAGLGEAAPGFRTIIVGGTGREDPCRLRRSENARPAAWRTLRGPV